jgi:Putative zinc binding domain
MKCHHCKVEVEQSFLDLGASPPSNAYLTKASLSAPEIYFPLRVLVVHELLAGADARLRECQRIV